MTKPEYIRVQAVLLRKKGYLRKEILEITGKSLSSLQDWITAFNQRGILALMTKERDVPPRYVLLKEQKDEIARLIKTHRPNQLGIPGEFWDIPKLKRLVKDHFAKEYQHSDSYRRLLHYCGLSYQKVELVDRRRKDEPREEFKKRFTAKLKKGAMSMWW